MDVFRAARWMARPSTSRLPVLDAEPRVPRRLSNGPPPAYRSFTDTDSCSDYSQGSAMGKRRASWSNLVESDENLNKHRVNVYPRVAAPIQQVAQYRAFGSATQLPLGHAPISRQNSQLTQASNVFDYIAMPKGSLPMKLNESGVGVSPSQTSDPSRGKRNRLQEMRQWLDRPRNGLCILGFILLLVIAAIVAIVLTQALKLPTNVTMQWLAPEMLRNGQNVYSEVKLAVEGEQTKLSLTGQLPFKGNFISYYDFKTNRVAVIDESLKGNNGRYLACFVLPLDRGALPSVSDVQRAAKNSKSRNQTGGWQETWTFQPAPLTAGAEQSLFQPNISECQGVRWIELNYVSANQQGMKCSDCYDFCLPDYGVERDSVRGETYLNVIRRDCFYLFVPEWRSYAQANTIEQNNNDFESYYRSGLYGTRNGQMGQNGYSPQQGQQGQQGQGQTQGGYGFVPFGGQGIPGQGGFSGQQQMTGQQTPQNQGFGNQGFNQGGNFGAGGGGGGGSGSGSSFGTNQQGSSIVFPTANTQSTTATTNPMHSLANSIESRWISLQNTPQRLANATVNTAQSVAGAVGGAVTGAVNTAQRTLFGGDGQQGLLPFGQNTNGQISQQFPGGGGGSWGSSPNGFNPGSSSSNGGMSAQLGANTYTPTATNYGNQGMFGGNTNGNGYQPGFSLSTGGPATQGGVSTYNPSSQLNGINGLSSSSNGFSSQSAPYSNGFGSPSTGQQSSQQSGVGYRPDVIPVTNLNTMNQNQGITGLSATGYSPQVMQQNGNGGGGAGRNNWMLGRGF